LSGRDLRQTHISAAGIEALADLRRAPRLQSIELHLTGRLGANAGIGSLGAFKDAPLLTTVTLNLQAGRTYGTEPIAVSLRNLQRMKDVPPSLVQSTPSVQAALFCTAFWVYKGIRA
jgi:hypothetical protein